VTWFPTELSVGSVARVAEEVLGSSGVDFASAVPAKGWTNAAYETPAARPDDHLYCREEPLVGVGSLLPAFAWPTDHRWSGLGAPVRASLPLHHRPVRRGQPDVPLEWVLA
jgi:hypothetical protein